MDNIHRTLTDRERGEKLREAFETFTKERRRFERIRTTRSLNLDEQQEYDALCSKLNIFYEKCRPFIKTRKNGPGKFMVEQYVNWCREQKAGSMDIQEQEDDRKVLKGRAVSRTILNNPGRSNMVREALRVSQKSSEILSQDDNLTETGYYSGQTALDEVDEDRSQIPLKWSFESQIYRRSLVDAKGSPDGNNFKRKFVVPEDIAVEAGQRGSRSDHTRVFKAVSKRQSALEIPNSYLSQKHYLEALANNPDLYNAPDGCLENRSYIGENPDSGVYMYGIEPGHEDPKRTALSPDYYTTFGVSNKEPSDVVCSSESNPYFDKLSPESALSSSINIAPNSILDSLKLPLNRNIREALNARGCVSSRAREHVKIPEIIQSCGNFEADVCKDPLFVIDPCFWRFFQENDDGNDFEAMPRRTLESYFNDLGHSGSLDEGLNHSILTYLDSLLHRTLLLAGAIGQSLSGRKIQAKDIVNIFKILARSPRPSSIFSEDCFNELMKKIKAVDKLEPKVEDQFDI